MGRVFFAGGKLGMKKPGSRLPSGYTELAYIQSSGTQYLDTGFAPNQNTRIVLKYGGCVDSAWCEVFGAGESVKNPANNFLLVQNASSGTQVQYGSEYYTAEITTDGAVIDLNKNKLYVSGVLVHTFTETTFASPYTMRLFDAATTSADYSLYSGVLYSCQIYDNDILIREFVPARRDSDGAVGLYDRVNKVFYVDASGTGFIAGPMVEMPDGYTALTYIQSSGTQYIDTEFKPNHNTRVVMDVYVNTPASTTLALFGARDTKSSTAPLMFVLWTASTGSKVRSDYFGTSKTGTTSIINTRIQVDKNKNIYTDTVGNSLTNTAATGQCANNMYLFGVNNAGSAGLFSSMDLYSCQVYDNGTLIRDYVPCVTDGGEIGLFDMVNGVFYGNAGSGVFIGEEVTA